MAGKVLEVKTMMTVDPVGCDVARFWQTNNNLRREWLAQKTELRKYIYATDTTTTTNSKLPWKNKTTVPKICQIRDNLRANYMAAMFPKRKNVKWEPHSRDMDTLEKAKAITGYMCYPLDQKEFKLEIAKTVDDYIDYGNAFAMPVWIDQRVDVQDGSGKQQVGYVGPCIRRISPLDIVFNPIAPTFDESPKVVRSLVSIGEIKEMLVSLSTDDNRDDYEKLWTYLLDYRDGLKNFTGDLSVKDEYLLVDGFTDYRSYLDSQYCEVLTFYGDLYDANTRKFYKNHIITVVDRHKVISMQPNPSWLGKTPIRHIGWRTRQDNLWAMGPLDNLVGMQYRIDHVENLKADVFDLVAFPPLKIKGYVEPFEWGPMARIVTDEEGDVEMMAPPWNVLTANIEIADKMAQMEELAGAPKEAMGIRTPGEKTLGEVTKLENAASRIFNSKIKQFEEFFTEDLMNDMLELSRRKLTGDILGRYYDDDLKITKFLDLTIDDITGLGRIKPVAARHFAEKAEMFQNLNNLWASPIGQDPGFKAHFSTIKLSKIYEDLLDLSDFNVVMPYVRMAEEADAQRISNAQQEDIIMEVMTSSGLKIDDVQPQGQPGATGAPPPMPEEPANAPPTGPFVSGPGFGQ